jgi:hypothetical protein
LLFSFKIRFVLVRGRKFQADNDFAAQPEGRAVAEKWLGKIGRGRAHRRLGIMNARIKVIDTWHGASCTGFIRQLSR